MAPWLSVLMPVHQGADYLAETLESAVRARPAGVEFLIYDSSTDADCADIVARYSDLLTIRYQTMPHEQRWPEKTNLAAKDARAPHLIMLHQDDLWLPQHIEAARDIITRYPQAVMSVGPSRFINRIGKDVGQWSLPLKAGLYEGAVFGRHLLTQNFLAIPSPIIARDAWLAVGGMNADLWYTADWDLYLKLAAYGAIAIRPQASTAFRIHSSSLTMTGSRDSDALRAQLEDVLHRHGPTFGLAADRKRHARATASADINCGLAMGAAGDQRWIWPTLAPLLRLGPINGLRYLQESRLIDRILPRLRERFSGAV